jgi:hypothetical protein
MAVILPGTAGAPSVSRKPLGFENSRDNAFKHPYIVVEAPPAEGKTFCALSVSEQWPEELFEGPGVEITDTAIIETDKGGLDGLLETRVTVKYVINLTDLSGLDMINAAREAAELLRPLVASGTIKHIIFDTGSVYDKVVQSYLIERFDGPQFWGQVRTEHLKLLNRYRALPVTFIMCVHLINKMDMTGSDAEKKAQAKIQAMAQGRDNPSGLCMDISGGGGRYLRDNASLILPLKKIRLAQDKNGRAQYERVLLPYAVDYDAKSRFTKNLDAREPANLRALINKVRAGIAQGESEAGIVRNETLTPTSATVVVAGKALDI